MLVADLFNGRWHGAEGRVGLRTCRRPVLCLPSLTKPSADKLDLADFSVEYAPQRRAVARSGGGACRCAWWKV